MSKHDGSCQCMGKAEAECVKKCEKLKADYIKPGFKFAVDY